MNSGQVERAKDNLNVEKTMTEDGMAWLASLGQQGGEDGLRALAQLMGFAVSSRIGAGKHERSGGQRSGRLGGRGG